MSDPAARLASAQARAAAARLRVAATAAALQERLEPRRLARQLARNATDGSRAVAAKSVERARQSPGLLTGFVAVAGLFLARHRVAALLTRRSRQPGATRIVDAPTRAPKGRQK